MGMLSSAFVAPGLGRTEAGRAESAVSMRAAGEYTGFVPDMQRRTLMNLVVTAATLVPTFVLLGGYILFFIPPMDSGSGGGTAVGDQDGNPIKLSDWMKTHRNKDRELVQGLK